MILKRLLKLILPLLISSCAYASNHAYHADNHSSSDWTILLSSPQTNFEKDDTLLASSCQFSKDDDYFYANCTVKAGTSLPINYGDSTVMAITDKTPVSHVYALSKQYISGRFYIKHAGSTGAVSLNRPADGDINIAGDSWGATPQIGNVRHIDNQSNADWVIRLRLRESDFDKEGQKIPSAPSLLVIHPPCTLSNNNIICKMTPFSTTDIEYNDEMQPGAANIAITDHNQMTHVYPRYEKNTSNREATNLNPILLNHPASGDINIHNSAWPDIIYDNIPYNNQIYNNSTSEWTILFDRMEQLRVIKPPCVLTEDNKIRCIASPLHRIELQYNYNTVFSTSNRLTLTDDNRQVSYTIYDYLNEDGYSHHWNWDDYSHRYPENENKQDKHNSILLNRPLPGDIIINQMP